MPIPERRNRRLHSQGACASLGKLYKTVPLCVPRFVKSSHSQTPKLLLHLSDDLVLAHEQERLPAEWILCT